MQGEDFPLGVKDLSQRSDNDHDYQLSGNAIRFRPATSNNPRIDCTPTDNSTITINAGSCSRTADQFSYRPTTSASFTGVDGGAASTQVISNFTFVPISRISAEQPAPDALALFWPAAMGGYGVQASSNLTTEADAWQDVAQPTLQANGRNQVTISPLAGSQYYRLSI